MLRSIDDTLWRSTHRMRKADVGCRLGFEELAVPAYSLALRFGFLRPASCYHITIPRRSFDR